MAISSVSTLPTFDKLSDESNYAVWKFQMELYLIHENLWKYTKTTPENDEYEIQQDQLARAKIGLMVEKECLSYLKKTSNAREAWQALQNAFEGAEGTNSSRLLTKLVSLKLEQFGSVKQYIAKFTAVAEELKDIDKEIDDELLASILLQGLGKKYASIRLGIEKSNHTLSTDYVKRKLLEIETLDDDSPSTDSEDYSRLRKVNKRQQNSRRDRQTYCRICDSNHTTRDYPELSMTLPKLRRENSSPKNYREAFRPSNRDYTPSNLLMDSDDHANMTPRRDYLCFVLCVRLLVSGLVRLFQLW